MLPLNLQIASQFDHSKYDCFLLVVMSHGLEGKVYAKDMAYPVGRLWQPFLGDSCPSLINKPKLFFIQACRGDELEKPVTYETVNRKVAYEYQSNVPHNEDMDEMKEMPNFVSTLTKKFILRLRKTD
uniref:Caspase family p20 domain-containing protein n=1 Tax=Megaselia scalaris TaxID=36166 RepID=T1GQM5_MEGSC